MRKIKIINAKDIDFLNALRVCGICSRQQALHEDFLSANRLRTFELNQIIEKCRDVDGLEVYRFTDKGKKWVSKNVQELANRSFYRSNGYQHDMCLFDRYIQLSSTERSTVLCEAEIRNMFREHLEDMREQDTARYNQLSEQLRTHEISMPDMCFFSNGQEVYYEAITTSYGTAELAAKEAFASELSATIEYHKI